MGRSARQIEQHIAKIRNVRLIKRLAVRWQGEFIEKTPPGRVWRVTVVEHQTDHRRRLALCGVDACQIAEQLLRQTRIQS